MKKQKFNVRMQTPNGIKYEEVDGYTEMIDGIAMGFHKVKIGREKIIGKLLICILVVL